MAWVVLAVAIGLAVLVAVLAVVLLRLTRRLSSLEARLAPAPSSDRNWLPGDPDGSQFVSLDGPGPAREPAHEYVITTVGTPEVEGEPVPVVEATLFADLVLKETVVQAASLFAGLRRALAPETRNRIRFEMRREVRRSRKQRRADIKEARREWAARQRAAMAADDRAETAA